MKYGYFDDKAKEYVITTPHTPLPWINYLGSNDFFSLISNTCGGYSFYKDAKLMRITRYRYNNIPVDSNGKYYYINDDGVIWNPGTMPSMTETDTYECRRIYRLFSEIHEIWTHRSTQSTGTQRSVYPFRICDNQYSQGVWHIAG